MGGMVVASSSPGMSFATLHVLWAAAVGFAAALAVFLLRSVIRIPGAAAVVAAVGASVRWIIVEILEIRIILLWMLLLLLLWRMVVMMEARRGKMKTPGMLLRIRILELQVHSEIVRSPSESIHSKRRIHETAIALAVAVRGRRMEG